jgi:hypothetical protein
MFCPGNVLLTAVMLTTISVFAGIAAAADICALVADTLVLPAASVSVSRTVLPAWTCTTSEAPSGAEPTCSVAPCSAVVRL